MRANEAFFAHKVVLVEGATEEWVLPLLLEHKGFDLLEHGVAIVSCGGKNELDRFYRLHTEFQIPCFLIFDGDKRHENDKKAKELNQEILKLFGESMDFPDGKVHEYYLGFTNVFESSFDNYDAGQGKGLAWYTKLKQDIENGKVTIPLWDDDLIMALKNMSNTPKSVLNREVNQGTIEKN